MEVEVECAYCWQSYSSSTENRIPRVLQCGHSLCTGCLGRVLAANSRGGLQCPTCRQPHSFTETPTVAAVPRNFALISSLERLQQRGAAGGLLAPESLVIGDRLPGTASTAAVYAGVLNLHNRQVQVAVKKLPTAQVSSAALSQFKLKLQTLAFASSMCNRLCRLLGFIVIDGNTCLVMRRYQQSLQQLLASSEGGKLPLAPAVGMALQVVQALEELQGHNIMHLSLKPSNILMDSAQHEVVLSDFATCHQLQTLPSMSSAAVNVPIQYMPPELVDDESAEPMPQADVWSMAAVLQQCLTGRPPYDGMSSVQVRRALLLRHAPGAVPEDIPNSLQQLLRRCFHETPEQRPSLVQIKQVLEAVLHHEGHGDWSPRLRHQASLQSPESIDPAVSAVVPIIDRTCMACGEEVANDQAVHFISGCSHIMCVSCSIQYVRSNMDSATPDLYPFRCPAHRLESGCPGQLVDISYLQLVSPQLLDEGVLPLSMEELQRYNQQQVFAAIPAHQRIQCPYPTCLALLFNANAPDLESLQLVTNQIREPCKMRCSHCERLLCQTCSEPWLGSHLCPRLREKQEEEERLSLAEVARLLQEQQLQEAEEAAQEEVRRQMREVEDRQRQLEERRQAQQAQVVQSEELIRGTSKPCPRCRAPITHFKGHACHHITPATVGGGCSVCHHQFCYMCLAAWHNCRCPTFCTDDCGCPPCPTCQPGQACDDCDGDRRCPSCNA